MLCTPEDRQVLRDAVAKDRSERSDVEGTAITGADHCFRTRLVSNTQPRSEIGVGITHTAVQRHAVDARNFDFSGVELQPAPVARAGNGLRVIDFPSQAIVDRDARGHPPSVLGVGKCPRLPFSGMQ